MTVQISKSMPSQYYPGRRTETNRAMRTHTGKGSVQDINATDLEIRGSIEERRCRFPNLRLTSGVSYSGCYTNFLCSLFLVFIAQFIKAFPKVATLDNWKE